jgi:hypothetical protein
LFENQDHKLPEVEIGFPDEEVKEAKLSDSDVDSEEAAKEYYSLKTKLPKIENRIKKARHARSE